MFTPGSAADAANRVAGTGEVTEVVQEKDGMALAREEDGAEMAAGKDGEVVVRKVHEADKVVVPKFPKVTNLKQWRIGVCRGLVNASGRSDGGEIPWLIAATDGTHDYDALEDSGEPRFHTCLLYTSPSPRDRG